MKVKMKLLSEQAKMPTRGSKNAAGLDLYACIDTAITLWPYTVHLIPIGIAMEIPDGYYGGIHVRSGLAKRGLLLATGVSVIDSDYRGQIFVPLYNGSEVRQKILPGDRVAQLIIQPVPDIELVQVDDLTETKRGDGGFGSTGR